MITQANTLNAVAPGRPFVIRDPVHGYLVAAVHERALIDHPVTQRLRRITQTGLAEYVFPEARTSRFVHSLGAMHVASRFVLAALENAELNVALNFFKEIESHIGRYSGERETFEDLLQQEGTLSALASVRSSFKYPQLREKTIRQLMAVTEAGLRLAALFHDLGHLPFSHDVEYALQDYAAQRSAQRNPMPVPLMAIAGDEAPHEEIGHKLAELAFHSLGADTKASVRAGFEMATNILNSKNPRYDLRKKPHASALQWLHSLVDGEIDADRADYLLRDGQALGLDFVHYDLDRLVSNLVLIEDSDLGFVTAVKETGVAALESYCLSRSRSSQVFIRHHKVAQAAAALRHSSVKAFSHSAAKDFLDLLAVLGGSEKNNPDDLLKRFSMFDEAWWLQVLKSVRLEKNDSLTDSCLSLVLERGRSLRSVWKRKGDLTHQQLTDLNSRADNFFSSGNGRMILAEKRRQLLQMGILLNVFKFKPYTIREESRQSVMLIKGKHRVEPASIISPLIRNVTSIWQEDIHVYAFVERKSSLELSEVVEAIVKD
jgi:HD superfamily phosphohydrolase